MSSFAPKLGTRTPTTVGRSRRHLRVRKKVTGTPTRPRLVVTRSARHMVVQVVDDTQGLTIASASTMEADLRGASDDKTAKARKVGQLVAERAKKAGIEAVVPFVDPLTSMLMPELPLTVVEWDEWGDPFHEEEVYDYMASYAPYDNVTAQAYPPILAETSLNDTRVLYVEPAKWVAKLRELSPTGADVLLRTEMAAGHAGVSGRYKSWHDRAFTLAWMLDRMGLSGALS